MIDKYKFSKNLKSFDRRKILVIIFGIFVISILVLILFKNIFRKSETYTVVNGYVEKSNNTQGIVIKQENVVNINSDNSIIPLIEQGKRVRKAESIAIYKDAKYQDYINQIDELDRQIEVLIKDLPEVYSNDISYIENQIELLGKQARNTTSYLKMQDYKNQIDSLANQKITLLGELSPSGSKVRELIEKRTKIEESYKHSSDNIRSPMSGCITYRVDGFENSANLSEIFNYTSNDFDDIYNKYNGNLLNDFGIKIVNNFLAYIVVKVPNNDYIKEGNSYSITFNDRSNLKENVKLSKVINIDDKTTYCIFKITNGIEKIIDSRIENIEIVWTKKNGMVVPLNSISLRENSNIGNVKVIKNGDYIEIPIKIEISNDNIAIVENLSDEEKVKNNIETNNKLDIFDQIIIKE